MNKQVEKLYKVNNDIFGQPQSYKNVLFYPLRLMDGEYLDLFYELFAYPQISVSIQDPRIYKMSYLKFLIYILQVIVDSELKEETIQSKLLRFLQHVTKEDNIKLNTPNVNAEIDDLIISLEVGDIRLTEMDFGNIREIILEQNGLTIEYVEEYNPQLEKDLEFLYKNDEEFNFKDQVFSLAAQFYKMPNELGDCTLYQMKGLLESMGAIHQYRLQVIPLTEVAEDYEFKSYTKHLAKRERYASVLQNVDEFKAQTDYSGDGNRRI